MRSLQRRLITLATLALDGVLALGLLSPPASADHIWIFHSSHASVVGCNNTGRYVTDNEPLLDEWKCVYAPNRWKLYVR